MHLACDLAQELKLTHIAAEVVHGYAAKPIAVAYRASKADISGIMPRWLVLVLVEHDTLDQSFRFVLDLESEHVLACLPTLLSLPVPWVGYDLKDSLFCLLRLGLIPPAQLWDILIGEAALTLGQYNKHYEAKRGPFDEPSMYETIRREQEIKSKKLRHLSLGGIATRHAIPVEKQSFSSVVDFESRDTPLLKQRDQRCLETAMTNAVASAALYKPQLLAAAAHGILNHLMQIEMPWVRTNAKIEWQGVRIDRDKADRIVATCPQHEATLREKLAAYHVTDPHDDRLLQGFLAQQGLLNLFKRNGRYSFNKDELKRQQHRHEAIPMILMARRCRDLLKSNALLLPGYIGADGRLHPVHTQLGSDSGRQTSKWPNILGTDYFLRPLIVPADGYGIGEIDLYQIEVGIAAAYHHDERLIETFNSGDAHSRMAQKYYVNELSAEDQALGGIEFKRKHRDKRNRMKEITLGLIYGMGPLGVAQRLGISKYEAQRLVDGFLDMYPTLRDALARYPAQCKLRGYADSITGLRRYRVQGMEYQGNEENWMVNHPIQASACAVFKHAGNRLRTSYAQYGARIIIPFHDAYVFEAPLEYFSKVADITERIMIEAVREYFPELKPRVEMNIEHPECWSKDGQFDLIEKWLVDPLSGLR
jgi:DNA polymerase-1